MKTSFSLSAADRFLSRYSPVDQQFSAFSEVMTPMTVVSTIYATAAKLYNCLLQHRAILPRCQQFAQAADKGAWARFPVASWECLALSHCRILAIGPQDTRFGSFRPA